MENEQEIRAAIQAVERAASRALESFDRMIIDGNMSNAQTAADDIHRITAYTERLNVILRAQAAATVQRILQELGIDPEQDSERQLETDGNVITFPGRPN